MSIKIGMISLGCPKNQVDAEMMLNALDKAGYEIVPAETDAEVIIVNTCGFIEAAKTEAVENILEAAAYKKEGTLRALIVTGCLAERYREDILEEMPEVDAVVSIGKNGDIAKIVEETLNRNKGLCYNAEKTDLCIDDERMLSTPFYMAYLKIAEGCDNCCTYCAIPSIRGRFRSRKIENIIKEAKALAQKGVKELVVIAQDTTRYGEDLYGEPSLAKLLGALSEIEGIEWIRTLYTYPDRITDELIDVVACNDKIVNYFDIPIQHCNANILKRMNRRGDKKSLVGLIEKIREKIPNVTLRTSLITGFPGETEENFSELCEFVGQVRFDRLGCFAFSAEEDTPAAEYPNQ
ncbi:MAG: 30S ribosomal protein S12 methylthiotransferase RimO, partial [Oscillospiraceae bacterium]